MIDIDVIWLLNLVYLLMRIIASFLRYTGFQNFIKDPIKVRKVVKISYQYNLAPYLTQDTTWEYDKNTIKYHK